MIRELNQKASHTIDFVIFDNIKSSDVDDGIMDLPFDQLSNLLFSQHHIRADKIGPNIWPVKLKPRDQWILSEKRPGDKGEPTYRTSDNVESISMIIMDMDKPGCLDLVHENFPQYKKIIYSTHSRSADTPNKYRLVLPVTRPINPDEWDKEIFDMMRAMTDGDSSCRNLSRLYYLPAHSPTAGIDPVMEKTEGEIISPDNIKELYNKFIKNNPEADRVRKRTPRHELAPQIKTNLNYTYEGLCARHKNRIQEYLSQEDSRHSFAMSTFYSEALTNRDEMNIPATIKFVFRAASEFSSKPLHLGNTVSEIPELLSSAIAKNAPGILKKFKSQADYSSFIEKCIKSSLDESMTGQWVFPLYRPKAGAIDKIDPYTKRSFVARHKNSIESLFSSPIPEAPPIITKILEEESSFEYASYGKAVTYLRMAMDKLKQPQPLSMLEKCISLSSIPPQEKQKIHLAVRLEGIKRQDPTQNLSESPSP